MNKPREFTLLALIVGVAAAVVMTAANVYLGLYAGMTISASIPAAVIAMGIFRGVLRRNSLLESNIVQTTASAGESLAAGAIFTLPALVIAGVWTDFQFWPTTLITIAGGILGVVFMVPLRRALIVRRKDLTYPEGVACASVLRSGSEGERGGVRQVVWGILVGSLLKFLEGGLHLLEGTAAWAVRTQRGICGFGLNLSPALMAVGYIVHLRIAVLVFLGGFIGFMVVLPMLSIPTNAEEGQSLWAIAMDLWSSRIRYLGVGAMVVGGLASIFSVRQGILAGIRQLAAIGKGTGGERDRTDTDLSLGHLILLLSLGVLITFGVYSLLIGDPGVSLLSTVVMVVLAFLFVAVSSYIVGLVGCSNNPVSGMTICALLATALLFLILGYQGTQAILVTLGVAAVVCCAACLAGDSSQDLKTGLLVGATPRHQQWCQVIGVVVCAWTIAPVLSLLNEAHGIGGEELPAAQATLFASIVKALFGDESLPYDMVAYGALLGVGVLVLDAVLKFQNSSFRLHLMPLAVGIYLPVYLSVPILVGGLVRWAVERRRGAEARGNDSGILLSSGFIAGEAIMGILVALFIVMGWVKGGEVSVYNKYVSLIPFVAVALLLYHGASRRSVPREGN